MMLGDSSLFSGSAELTTKEILKRYNEHAKAPTANGPSSPGSSPQTYSRSGNRQQTAPTVQRIDTDPNVWQNESSVRHVGGPTAGLTYSSSQQQTPTNQQYPYDLGNPNAPYAQGSSDSVNGSPKRGSLRNSALQKSGALGITGA